MKAVFSRVLILLLICCLVLSGCNTDAPTPTTETTEPVVETTAVSYTLDDSGPAISNLSVGFGRVDISPTESTPLRGYGFSSGRMSTGIQDPLYATCIALTDSNDNTVLLFTLDMTNSYGDVMDAARLKISEETGVPFGAIMVSATHNHSSPDLLNTAEPSIPTYIESLKTWMVEAAVAALDDRALTRVYITTAETENLNFVRRYQLQNGTYAGDNFGSFTNSTIVEPAEQADKQLLAIKFAREGKQDVVMSNWQAHVTYGTSSTSTLISSCFVGIARDHFEENTGDLFIYFTGACGNTNCVSKIGNQNRFSNYTQYSEILSQEIINLTKTMDESHIAEFKTSKITYTGQVDHSQDGLVAVASSVWTTWQQTLDSATAMKHAEGYPINSVYHANRIIGNSRMDQTFDVYMVAWSFGDVSGIVLPYEMFDTNGMYIKENTPFARTFIIGYSWPANLSYIPSALGFENGGYETRESVELMPDKNAGYEIAENTIKLLMH